MLICHAQTLRSNIHSFTFYELPTMAFTLPNLPYEPSALEQSIDTRTMEIHHGKHHAAYVDKLNGAIANQADLQSKSLEDLVRHIGDLPEAVRGPIRNNGGGHWNHSFFWELLTPKSSKAPVGKLAEAITAKFGSFDKLKEDVNAAGLNRFGSGWAWLIVNAAGDLQVTSSPNQDNPLMDIADVKGKPVLGIDVWEHAYYLKYQNRRPDYLAAIWDVINWEKANEHFLGA
jgi:superoxide dismutase, Fe-Mn family